ncbi:sulfatase family protein [Persicirhabdus sediminis]|uniref:Arylsulfatase n=1 Tax=Persicirhabdus sediminis TaxID=454144 RepID=A0A8J7MCM5_9BACT|nr:arylsulfatase [Persicirhabdus sediminis]MBK1789844.1 arylsulfatase [Persicirhabdus sediminis]
MKLFSPKIILPLAITAISSAALAQRPNIVLIFADDMGHGDISCQNPNGKIPTPNLDKLASQGMRFTDGHSSSGICTPSRFALLTGQHHWRKFHGIVGSFGESVFEPDDFTIAKMLSESGYNTAAIGKWHLGWNWKSLETGKNDAPEGAKNAQGPAAYDWSKPIPMGPLDQGFDYYFGDGTINFPPYCWIENDKVVEPPTVMMDTDTFKPIPEGRWEFRPGPMLDGWDPYKVLPTLTDKAVEWIGKQTAEKPFFLYFALPSPHAPIIPNDEYVGKSQAGPYGDFVYESDAMAGRIIKAIEDKGFADNTIVIFSADNGPEGYAYDRLKKTNHNSSGELRGLKRDLYEGGHRVPFIISWPGKTKAGSVSNQTISQVDLAATFAAAAGTTIPNDKAIDSHDLTPLLAGEDKPIRKSTVQNTKPKAFALRSGDWLYMNTNSGFTRRPDATKNGEDYKTKGLLFNLKDDLGQQNNLFDSEPERVERMDKELNEYIDGKRTAPTRP